MLIKTYLQRFGAVIILLLQRRCDGPFRESGVVKPFLFLLNSNKLFRNLVRGISWLTHPVHAVVVGDRNSTFFKYGWSTLDLEGPADYQVNIRAALLPFGDDTVGYLYASHILEHLNDQDLQKFLLESYRVLAPEGFFRIVVPDFDAFLRSFREDVLSLHFDRPASHSTAHSVRDGLRIYHKDLPELIEPHNGLIGVAASFTNGRTPLQVSRSEFDRNFTPDDLDNFVSWAVSLKPQEEDFGHCNAFNFHRLARFLREAGFDRVSRGFYRDPFVPRRMTGIDLPNKQHISLYVNAGKS